MFSMAMMVAPAVCPVNIQLAATRVIPQAKTGSAKSASAHTMTAPEGRSKTADATSPAA